MIDVRDALVADIEALSASWFEGWQDAHADILPAEIARHRTLQSFRNRTRATRAQFRVTGPVGAPLGFTLIRGDELNRFYVTRHARGSGAAVSLMVDVERAFARNRIEIAWLACAIGNDRAAHFYERNGWLRAGLKTIHLELPTGHFPLEVWRYEKRIGCS